MPVYLFNQLSGHLYIYFLIKTALICKVQPQNHCLGGLIISHCILGLVVCIIFMLFLGTNGTVTPNDYRRKGINQTFDDQ